MTSKQCVKVLITFDFDAESLWMSLGMTTPMPLSRGTYGAQVGVPRILSLLEKKGVKATFFVPGETARRHPETVKSIHVQGHELAHHGDIHESPIGLSREEERAALVRGIDTLAEITGKSPRGYRSPSWDFSDNTVELLEELGFVWDSSLMADDFNCYAISHQERKTSITEIPVSYELDDAPYFLFCFKPYLTGMANPDQVLSIWKKEFDGALLHSGVFNLTLHPQLIGRWHRLAILEELIDYIKSHPGAEFLSCSEAIERTK
jgi:peptidoglycan-N-acetylglucosamine deacetylase